MTVRIGLVVDSPSRRAHGNAVSRLALGLVETGRAEVDLVCYSDDPAPPWLPAQVRIHRLGVDRVSRSVLPLVDYLATRRPDVLVTRQVHANFVGLAASSIGRRTRGWRGRLVLVQDHPIELSHASNWRDNKWAAKATYRFADGVICPSPAVRESTIAWCGLDPALTALVPNPMPVLQVDRAAAHPWLEEGQPPTFVHTSNMTPWKRLDLLVSAFAEVRRTHEARLLLVGEGPMRAATDEQIRRLGLHDDARTVGWVEDPLRFAARAWAFVLPSDEEGFAQVLTEAMSVGCPVITTDSQGGGPRFVTDGGTYGMLVPRGDRASLAQAMARMLDPDVRASYAQLGDRRVRALSPEASANALLDLVTEIMGPLPRHAG